MEYISSVLTACPTIMVFVPYTLRFWEFWKHIEDNEISWYSLPHTIFIHLPFTLWISDCCVYNHTLNFRVSVRMLLTTPGSFCSTIFPTQAFEIQPVSKASSKVTFSGRSPQVLWEEFLPLLCASSSAPIPPYPTQVPYWTKHSPALIRNINIWS